MAGRRRQDLLGKLADPFEDALQRLGHIPGTQQFVRAAAGLRDRVDDLAKRIGRLDELEKRVRDLERRVNQMSGGTRAAGRRTTRRATGSAAKRSTTGKTTSRRTTRSPSPPPRRRRGES